MYNILCTLRVGTIYSTWDIEIADSHVEWNVSNRPLFSEFPIGFYLLRLRNQPWHAAKRLFKLPEASTAIIANAYLLTPVS